MLLQIMVVRFFTFLLLDYGCTLFNLIFFKERLEIKMIRKQHFYLVAGCMGKRGGLTV